ncbi:MAG: alanine--tRNA ligase [Planctomycetes bacterium]|nr:alanine--tRNA ligase [Planctomycetota bacterium]
MKTSEIRSAYLAFFEERGHKVVRSDSLVPSGDPSLLFTGAGMNQFKDMFLGRGNLPFTRATSCQKCIRTGDIDSVGRTARHGTFFEMLGNFSFGDYFKKESILWAWEFMTDVLGVAKDRLYISIYNQDEEAYGIWTGGVGIPADRVYRMGEHDNFWPADAPANGPNGPCGPCSEIFVDLGESVGCGGADCAPGCDCDRFVEVWNLVFTQFERKDGGLLEPLPQKNIDTGMGLERIAAVMQGKTNNFENDVLFPLVKHAAAIAAKSYGENPETDRRLRRIADHSRAACFAIGDGVLPSNEGRGYVVRRLIRRAEVDGAALGIDGPFVHNMVETVSTLMGEVYPEVADRADNITAFIRNEEERFRRTLSNGIDRLEEMTKKIPGGGIFAGQDAFVLYDTFGFPVELTREILGEKGIAFDEEGFLAAMEAGRERARSGAAFGDIFPSGPIENVKEKLRRTEFVGYAVESIEEPVAAIVAGSGVTDSIKEGGEGVVFFARTPFYAESGGQVADTGRIQQDSGWAEVRDVQLSGDVVLHRVKVGEGSLHSGKPARLAVDAARRTAVRRNHTATHLLHRALRQVLGDHVEQSGSLVTADRLRLDFTHFEAIPADVLRRVETLVNEWIMADLPVATVELPIEEAKAKGAMALFGEKYGENVRMVEVEGTSRELCGGTHLNRTGKTGLFLILREESISAGVRRIEAVTGAAAWEAVCDSRDAILRIARELKVPAVDVPARVGTLRDRCRDLEKDLRRERARAGASGDVRTFRAGDADLVHGHLAEGDSADVNNLADTLRPGLKPPFVLVVSGVKDGKVALGIWVDKSLVDRGVSALELIKAAAPHIRGGGGGRPERAQAGGKDPSGLDAAVAAVAKLLAGG